MVSVALLGVLAGWFYDGFGQVCSVSCFNFRRFLGGRRLVLSLEWDWIGCCQNIKWYMTVSCPTFVLVIW